MRYSSQSAFAAYSGPKAVRLSAKAIILDSTGEIVLQLRGPDEPNAGKLGAFGGGYDANRRERDPAETLVNELKEELERNVHPLKTQRLRRFSQNLDLGPRDVHYFFWHNRGRPLSVCKEGEIARFSSVGEILGQHHIGRNLRQALTIAHSRGLIPG